MMGAKSVAKFTVTAFETCKSSRFPSANRSKPVLVNQINMFPLELTPLELLFFYDNRIERPSNFIIQIELTGIADKDLLERSLSLACSRNPLVTATVKRGKGRRWYWHEGSEGPKIDWINSVEKIDVTGREKIDLRQQIGLRVWASATNESTTLLMEFNHACTDGIGAYRLIGDMMAIYHSLFVGRSWDFELPTIDSEKLACRFDRLEKEIRERKWLSRMGITLREGYDYLGPPVNRVHPRKKTSPTGPSSFPGLVSFSFSKPDHQKLKKAAVENGYSVNDLLIAELFLTIHDWNQENPSWSWSWRKRIRLSLPTDMRDQTDYATSAANLTALAFLTRHQKELNDSEELRASVRQEVLKIRNSRKGIDNLITLDTLSNLPFPALWLSTRATCCYSAVISNIGDPTRRMLNQFEKEKQQLIVGNLKLDLITGVPPMRPDTNLAVSIFSYRRLMTISFRCDPHLFDHQDTSDLLSIYTRRLRSYFEPESVVADSAKQKTNE